jgi:cyclopropane-fatty-acyl-phospholipid synthase
MNVIQAATGAVERLPFPDSLTRAGISALVGRTGRRLAAATALDAAFAADMAAFPIAMHTDDANAQHYELPPAFFAHILGPRRKYSSCLYETPASTLAEAEEYALAETAAHAGLLDGQDILELGCGWGSLSLWMAEHFPRSRIVAVSNAAGQRGHIEATAAQRGLTNLRVVTADMNAFAPEGTFDRIVSVEMFEHMANWGALLSRVREWLRPDGRLFVHVFSHRAAPYRFDLGDKADWIARHFFTGGIMPSHGLIRQFPTFAVEQEWRWSGTHYQRTADDWLANYDGHAAEITPILRQVYGDRAGIWRRRWRLFFLATSGLFGHAGGNEWGISHYRLKPA